MIPLAFRDGVLEPLHGYFRSGDSGDSSWMVLLIALPVMIASGFYVWRWLRRMERNPSSRVLLRTLAERTGLSALQRRLVWRVARAAGMEPAAALLGPSVLTQMLRKAQREGLELSAEQTAQYNQLLDRVVASSGRQEMSGGATPVE